MNERIRELLKQASKLANTEDTKDFDRNFDMIVAEKFAELIVKETMQVVANNLPPNTYLDVADAVIEHFKE